MRFLCNNIILPIWQAHKNDFGIIPYAHRQGNPSQLYMYTPSTRFVEWVNTKCKQNSRTIAKPPKPRVFWFVPSNDPDLSTDSFNRSHIPLVISVYTIWHRCHVPGHPQARFHLITISCCAPLKRCIHIFLSAVASLMIIDFCVRSALRRANNIEIKCNI